MHIGILQHNDDVIGGKDITDTLKVPRMKAVRISHWCLAWAALGRVMFGQGWGCIILESALMTFAPNQNAPRLLCPLRQPANSTSPGSFAQCANGGVSLR